MKLKYRNFIWLGLVCFTPLALANTINGSTSPTKCPSVEALKSIHIQRSDLRKVSAGQWSVKEYTGRFDTVDRWAFNLETIQAKNAKQALEEANNKLFSLVYAYGPLRYIYRGQWHCSYYTNTNDVRTVYLGST